MFGSCVSGFVGRHIESRYYVADTYITSPWSPSTIYPGSATHHCHISEQYYYRHNLFIHPSIHPFIQKLYISHGPVVRIHKVRRQNDHHRPPARTMDSRPPHNHRHHDTSPHHLPTTSSTSPLPAQISNRSPIHYQQKTSIKHDHRRSTYNHNPITRAGISICIRQGSSDGSLEGTHDCIEQICNQ